MRRKLKQKRCNFEVTEIWKKRNFEADSERGDANRGISVLGFFCVQNRGKTQKKKKKNLDGGHENKQKTEKKLF